MNIDDKLITKEFYGMKSRIGEIIKEKGLRQNYVADKVGVSKQQLNDWIKDRAYPRLDRAYKLAEVLGVSVNDLYEED